jgi:hypothetical protein
MKPVLFEKEQIHYVDDVDLIRFISENTSMGLSWNKCCDFVRDNNIVSYDGNKVYWVKQDLIDRPEEYNEEQVKWVTAFFEAHPWIEKMMVVFDS